MSNYHSHYYPQSRYEHPKPKGTSTSHERHPLAPRYSSNPALQQRNLPHFNSIQTIPELIQIAHANITTLTPSSIAAFWNKMSKLVSGRNVPISSLPNHDEELQLGSYLHRIFDHTQNNMLGFFSMKDLSQAIYSMAKLVDVLRKNYERRRGIGDDIVDVLSRRLLNSDLTPKKELFHSFACAVRDKIDKFDARGLSNIAYAYALIGYVPNFHDGSDLFDLIAAQAVQQRIEFNPQDLANTVWAYATAGINHPRLFEKMANHIVKSDILHRFDPQALANTVWAYATAQVSHPKLFQKVASAALQRKTEFNSLDVAHLLWAYATLGIVEKQLFLSFVPTAAKLIDFCNNQDLANIAWAYTVADVEEASLFNRKFITLDEKNEGFEVEALGQLYQWHLWQTKEKCNPGLPEELSDRCHEAFISQDVQPSRLQGDVASQLSSIGLDPKEEVLMGSGNRIDAIVEVNGKQVGIEVDGPYHFIGRSKSPLAKTILKRRQVSSIDGTELVSVPYWEWDKLGEDQTEKQEYLRNLLGL